jgi:hypothetical protein
VAEVLDPGMDKLNRQLESEAPTAVRSNRGEGRVPRSIPRLLRILSGMGIEIRVRDQELDYQFMNPWKIFDRDPLTDERRIASNRRSQPFQEMLERKVEIIEHWHKSPGDVIRDYPDRLRIHTIAFQEMLVEEQRQRGWLVKIYPHAEKMRWLE